MIYVAILFLMYFVQCCLLSYLVSKDSNKGIVLFLSLMTVTNLILFIITLIAEMNK